MAQMDKSFQTTTFVPMNKVKFYLPVSCSLLEPRADNLYLSFKLPVNVAFPSNLEPIISQVKRVVSFEKSNITGTSSDSTIVCQGQSCIGMVSDTEKITYTMKPLYPPTSSFLSEYKPKFGFVKYISTTMSTTNPPLKYRSTSQPSQTISPFLNTDVAIFSITYEDVYTFNTTEIFTRLYNSIVQNQNIFFMIDDKKYAEHNMAMLQKVQKKNKIPSNSSLPMTLPKQKQETTNKSSSKSSSQGQQKPGTETESNSSSQEKKSPSGFFDLFSNKSSQKQSTERFVHTYTDMDSVYKNFYY